MSIVGGKFSPVITKLSPPAGFIAVFFETAVKAKVTSKAATELPIFTSPLGV